ncbi:aspartate kinase [Aurantibacter sp.]|uniref:aspartate kinase n=1 Tax=Aurantibacter sp. TaxID=2807103 RepID=UPI0035C8673F
MRIFKFGGASVKDANGIKNLVKVLQYAGYKNTLIVVSAMGKTTNDLEQVIDSYFNNKVELSAAITKVENYHYSILLDLFKTDSHDVFKTVKSIFKDLNLFLKTNKSPDYNFVYDQIIGFGELLSTKVISTYLNTVDINNIWLDVRSLIKTDNYYRKANVNWGKTQEQIKTAISKNTLYITQGFLGSDANNFTTTLGREGSDYTAAIFGYTLNAESVTIWKDVPGVLNADPRYFEQTKLLENISYTEAIELAFYGASVIHPKTLQPLQQKEIPLHVKSFLNPENNGTIVNKTQVISPLMPCFILKRNQILISISTIDFSYIVEENISEIFTLLATYKMKVDVIQNSAISFSVCVENVFNNLEALLLHLKAKFKVTCHPNVNLYTIRHFNENVIKDLELNKKVLLKQQFQETVQIVTK